MPTGVYPRTEYHRNIIKKFHKGMSGLHCSEETKRKIAEANKGKRHSKGTEFKKGRIKEETYVWKGMEAGYRARHNWIAYHYGKPDTCEHCLKSGLKGIQIHWANKSGEYKREREDWLRLCVKCHAIYDKENGGAKININFNG